MKWNHLDYKDKIAAYEEAYTTLKSFAESAFPASREDLKASFLKPLPLDRILDRLERNAYKRIYSLFYEDWFLLDYRKSKKEPSLADACLADHNYDEIQKTALSNLAASFIAPYRVLGIYNGMLRLESILTEKTNFSVRSNLSNVMPGDIIVTRLLPLEKDWLLSEPWLLVMPISEKDFTSDLIRAMKETGFGKRDGKNFLKQSTPSFLKVINTTLIEMEKDMVRMIDRLPYLPEWFSIQVESPDTLLTALQNSPDILSVDPESDRRFIYFSQLPADRLSWVYISFNHEDQILACIPARESIESFLPVLSALHVDAAFSRIHTPDGNGQEQDNRTMLRDLADLLNANERLTEQLLLPRRTSREAHVEQARADFFAKLSLQLGRLS